MKKPTIGFIGLGLMGGNMVENLQNRGFELTVMDLNKDEVARVMLVVMLQKLLRQKNWQKKAIL